MSATIPIFVPVVPAFDDTGLFEGAPVPMSPDRGPASAGSGAVVLPSRRGAVDRGAGVGVRIVEQSVAKLQESMTAFVQGVQEMLSRSFEVAGQFAIDSVEVEAQIGGEGKIGFAGNGLQISGHSNVKIVFKRAPPP